MTEQFLDEKKEETVHTSEGEIISTEEWAREPLELVKQKTSGKREKGMLREVFIYILLLVICVKIIPTYIIQRTIVDGPSMEDTLQDGNHLLVEKISYRFDQLKRFDIIAFYPYGREEDEDYYIKRIIGLPGETIQIIGSDIYIDGEVLEESYGKDPINFAGIAGDAITLADDEYFVLGDNRTISKDSRFREVGVVNKENIGGRAILRIWPLDEFGLLN